MDGFKLPEIPTLTLQEGVKKEEVDAEKISGEWLSKLEKRFAERSFSNISDLFIDNCWWRDIVGLSWDFTCKQGQDNIKKYLASANHGLSELQTNKLGGLKPLLLDFDGMVWIQTGFTFKTPHGEGKGLLKLGNTGKDEWKAWTVFTQLEKLDFQKEVEERHATSIPIPKTPVTNGVNGVNGINGHAHAEPEEDLQ
ncbi:uncharacterized protein BDZ83DRAFT_757600, partial [Colletotrichum acutatum]